VALPLGICLIPLPANTTPFLQPIDNKFNAVYKAKCRKRWEEIWLLHKFMREAATQPASSSPSSSLSSSVPRSATASTTANPTAAMRATAASANVHTNDAGRANQPEPAHELHTRIPASAFNLEISNNMIGNDEFYRAFAHERKQQLPTPIQVWEAVSRSDDALINSAISDAHAEAIRAMNEDFANGQFLAVDDPALAQKVRVHSQGTKVAFREVMMIDVLVHAYNQMTAEPEFTQKVWIDSLFRVDGFMRAPPPSQSASSSSSSSASSSSTVLSA
jgi:hypothetical protein